MITWGEHGKLDMQLRKKISCNQGTSAGTAHNKSFHDIRNVASHAFWTEAWLQQMLIKARAQPSQASRHASRPQPTLRARAQTKCSSLLPAWYSSKAQGAGVLSPTPPALARGKMLL